MPDALPPATPSEFAPIDFGTWSSTPEAARIEDPLAKVQAYDNRLRKDLFKAGLYDADAEAEISAAGADQALRAGLIADPAEYAPTAKPRDPNFLARQLIRQGDTVKAQDLYRYQSFLSRPDTDPETLERARQAAQLESETENELVRKAVRAGELPFAVVPDAEGNVVFEIDPELGALDRQQILDLAGEDIDPRFLPDLEKQLTRVPGTNYTPAQFRQSAVFDGFLKEQIKTDEFLFGQLDQAQTEYNRTGQLSTETQEALDRSLAALDVNNEFAPATRSRLIRDTIKRGSKPEAYDPENPQQHVQYLEDGTVWLPEQVIFDEATHNKVLDSLNVTPEQKENAKKLRAGRLESIAPAMVDAMGANPDALDFYETSKAAGKSDSEIATEWYSKPENYGSFANRARSFGMSLIEAGPGLIQSIGALAGSDSAREALATRAQDTARNEEYARLFGDSYGVGQSLLNTSSQVAADLLAGIAVSAVATPAAGAAVVGARATASSLVRGLARTALAEGSRSAAAGFLRSGAGSAARTLATMGDDVAANLARSIAGQTGVAASSFTRSAGSAYVQAYSALDAQTNPAGQPLYSDAEKRKIALGTAMTAGMATAAITLGFGKILGGGVEDFVTGKIGTGVLKRIFGATDEQITAATRTSALAILKAAGAEAPEEAVDQLVGNVIQALGTGEEFRLGPALKEALEAGLVGGLLGAGTKSIEVGIDKYRSPKVVALEKSGSPVTAATLEAATKAKAEAPAAKPTVINQDGLRIQDNPPLSPDPLTYGEEDPDAPNPALTPSTPPPATDALSPDPFSYGIEESVGITDTGGAVRVSAAEIEGQIDAVDVQLADLKVVPANETEGQKARRTRRLQELNAEKVRLKAAVKNAKASGGFVFLAQEQRATTQAERASTTQAERASTTQALAPEPSDTALDYGDGSPLTVQDNTLAGPTPGSTAATPQPAATPAPEAPPVPEDIIGTDQAPEPPDVEVVPEPGETELDATAPTRKIEDYPTSVDPESFTRYRQSLVETSEEGSGVPGMTVKQYSAAAKKGIAWAAAQLEDIRQQNPEGSSEYIRARDRLQASAQKKTPQYSSLGSRVTNDNYVFWKEASSFVTAQNSADYFASAIRRGGKRDLEDVLDYKVPEWHTFRAPVADPAPSLAPKTKKPTDESRAAEMRAGKPIPVHQTLFDDTISQGWVPTRNVLLSQLKESGYGGKLYGTAFAETAEARIRELYPLVDVPKTAETKTLKSLGLGDIKGAGNKLVSIPVFSDGKTAPFTNDPVVTSWQKAAGLSVKVPAGVSINPAIGVNAKTGFVDSAVNALGVRIFSKGDFKRAGTTIGSYIAFQNKTGFGASLGTLPPFDSSKLAGPVDFAGFKILPGETTEDDILRFFFAPSSDGGPSKIDQAINASAGSMSAVDKDQIRNAAQLSFVRELREFTLDMNDVGSVDPKGFLRTPDGYKAGLENRIANVWSKADTDKDGVTDTSKHWNERGRPSHLSFFVKNAIKAQEKANEIRPDANVQLGSDDVDQATALERAAARNEADNAGDMLVALDEAFTPEVLRGSAAIMGRPPETGIVDIASGVQILVSRIDSVPALRKAFEQAYLATLALPPGPSAKRAVAIQQAKAMASDELVVLASRSALMQPGVVQAIRDAGFFKSVSYGLNTFTDAEIEQHRADNRAAVADLQIDGDLRSAIERVARSAKYPRRYRAVMLAALKMQVLPNLSIVDAPAEAYAGSYIHSGRLITLNIASSNGRGLLDVLAHELLHAATIEAVANPQTKIARDLVAKLERARQKAAEVIPDDMAYAVSSLDEFITHAATDPRLQVVLRETFEKGKTTWQRVVEAIAKFFGIANNDFVSDLWGFINHAAEYGYRVGVAASREAEPVAPVLFAPASRRNQLRVRLTREALTNMALEQAEWKDWYTTHQDTLDEFFGDHSGMFQSILAATSQAATVKSNVALALRAFGQWIRGEAFEGFLPAVKMNLERLRNEVQLEGQKISAYRAANEGDSDQVVVDRHIARLLFGVETPSRAQFQKATTVLTQIAENLGWKPSQVQAALWAASIVKSGKTPESYADYLRKLEAKSEVGSRIGAPIAGSPGIDGAGGDRGRFAPRGAQASGRDGGDPGSVDQHLPQLPAGLAYAFDDSRPKYLAYARRSQPGTVTVNRQALAAAVEGLDPANARAIVSKVIKHEIAHLAAFSAFTDAEIAEMARGLSMSELGDIARRYYNSPDAMARLTADIGSGVMTSESLVEEYLRMQVEMISDGSTTEETIAFHSSDPGFAARILRYIRDFVKSLWSQVAGPTEDYLTRVTINRLMREYRAIKRGHLPPVQPPFDPGDPYRDNRLGALATGDGTDPEAAVLSDFMRQETFIDFSGAHTEPPAGWRGTLKQILKTRSGDPRMDAIKNERTARITAANTLLANREKAMRRAMKEENPDRELVNQALGDKSPTIPPQIRKDLKAQFESDLQEVAAASADKQIDLDVEFSNRLASGESREAALDWLAGEQNKLDAEERAARQEAYDNYDKARRQALAETAREKKARISEAFDALRATHPKTADAVKKFRSAIDSMSAVMRDTHPEDSFLHAVLDENMGVYVTTTYRVHHGDADPLAIFASEDPADIATVAEAQELFVSTIIDGRAEEIMEEEAEAGKIISFAEAEELARAWADENEIGRKALEDYLASHGGRAFYHGGGNFKIDLTRYMQRGDVPEALRKVLGEVEDPVENAARTFANVSYMAANHRFIEDLARGGKASGALVTKGQKDGFADLIRMTGEDEYIQGTIDFGFARRTPTTGYVQVADGVYHPMWLVEARDKRDFRKLEGYESLATTNKKYGAGSLDGLYAPPLVKAFFENAIPKPPTLESEKLVHRFGSFFAKATGASLGVATVTNPGFHTRNMLGGAFFLMANGINPFRNIGVVMNHFGDLVSGKDNAEVLKRIALGVYNNDTRPEAIKELIKDETDRPGDRSGFEWFGNLIGGKRGLEVGKKITSGALKLTDFAGAVDSAIKGMAYEAELRTLREAYPDWAQDRLERAAADIILRTHQARSMTVPIAEDVTRSSFGRLFSPFLRFRAEMFRITHGTIMQSLEEIKSDNPVIQARGRERLAGFVMVSALSLAGPALVSAMFGVGGDEEEALRESLPPYLKGNSLTYFTSNGSVTSLDMTFVNPYSNLFDPVSRTSRALFRGEPGDAAGEVAAWMSGQLLDEQIAAGAALEVLNNRTSDNKPIVLDTDGFVESTVKYSKHLLSSAYTPQVLKTIDRAIEAQRRGVPETAEMFETPAGLLASSVLPVRGRTFQTSDMALRAFKSKAQTLRDIRTLSGQYKRRQNLDEQDINGITEDIHDSMVSLYEDLDQIARGFEGLGMEKADIIKQMVNAGHSREKARGVVVRGVVPAPALTPATKRDIFDAGEAVSPDGGGARRVKLVRESQQSLPRTIDLRGPAED